MTIPPLFIRSGIHKLFNPFISLFLKFYWFIKYVDFIKDLKKKGIINDYYNSGAEYKNRYALHSEIIKVIGDEPITYLEFGVAGGDMMKHWVNGHTNSDSRFIGFDSFEGLPEGWENKSAGHFDQQGIFPDIRDSRVQFEKGWFQDTVPNAIEQLTFSNQSVFHLDADLFSSTLFVLFQLFSKFKSGDILIFDEFSSHVHEYRALELFEECSNRKWEINFLGAVNNYRQVAFQLSEK